MKIRVLIVDDEPWARRRVCTLLKVEPDIEVVGQCSNGQEAVREINRLSPDLVLLDVQMPDMNGFDVVEAIGPARMPLVIFATAYDKYALRAFDAHAMDYLLKPFDEERFHAALIRARNDLRDKSVSHRTLTSLLDRLHDGREHLQRLAVKSGARVVFLKVTDIDWFEASANYVALHVGRETHLLRTTMSALEPKLDPQQFVRIQRSTMVNVERIKELQPWNRGEQVLILKDGTELTLGRVYRSKLERFLENSVG